MRPWLSRLKQRFSIKGIIWILIIVAIFWVGMHSCSNERHQKNLYLIGRDNSWYPLQLFGRERNLIGFTNDLMSAVMKLSGLHFQLIESSPNTLMEGLEHEHYDALMSAMQPNAANRQTHLFSEPIIDIGPVLIVRKDSSVTSIKEMAGQIIGVITSASQLFSAAPPNDLTFVRYQNGNQAIEALLKNQIDGVIIDALTAYTHAEGFYADRIKVVTAPLNEMGLRLVALKIPSSEVLIEEFDDALEELRDDGTYQTLLKKWDLIDPATRHKGSLQ